MKELTVDATIENIAAVTDFVNGQLERLGCPLKRRCRLTSPLTNCSGT